MICALLVRVYPNFRLSRNTFYCERKKNGPDGMRDNTTIRNYFLSQTEMQRKLKAQKEKLNEKDSKLFFLESKNLRLRMRK